MPPKIKQPSNKTDHANGHIYPRANGTFRAVRWHRGECSRRVFKTRRAAELWLNTLDISIQNDETPLTPIQYAEAQAARNLLPEGYSILEAVRWFVKQEVRVVEQISVAEAVLRYKRHKEKTASRLYYETICYRLAALEATVPLQLTEITPAHIVAHLEKFPAPQSKLNVLSDLAVFFKWCIANEYLMADPTAKIERPRIPEKMPEFISVDAARDLMTWLEDTHPDLAPYYALGLFAGLRPTEITRLTWEAVKDDHIRIAGEDSKTRQHRIIEIMPNLAKWIAQYRATGPVCTRQYPTGPALKSGRKYPKDFARHSFATYHLALFESSEKTAFQLGHGLNPGMLLRHYRGLATRQESKDYFAIFPKKQPSKTPRSATKQPAKS